METFDIIVRWDAEKKQFVSEPVFSVRGLDGLVGTGTTRSAAVENMERELAKFRGMIDKVLRLEAKGADGPGYVVYSVHGELADDNVAFLRDGLRDQVEDPSDKRAIILDLGDVSYVDSTALGVLVGTVRRMKDSKRPFYLVNLVPFVERAFVITHLDKQFPLLPSVKAAIEAIR